METNNEYSVQRTGFAMELKDHIAMRGGESGNEEGGILGVLHRTWIDIKQALSSKEAYTCLSSSTNNGAWCVSNGTD